MLERPHQRPSKSPAVMHFRTSSSAAFNAPFPPDRVLNFAWKARACRPPWHERLLHTAPSSFRHFSRAVCVANVAAKFEQNSVTIFVLCWIKRKASQSGFVLFETVSDALCLFCLRWAGFKRIKCKVYVQSEEEVLLWFLLLFFYLLLKEALCWCFLVFSGRFIISFSC